MSAHSKRKRRSRKAADRPKKPYPDFPLYPHPLGYWSKKVNGTIRNFGRWGRVVNGALTRLDGDGWKEALELFQAQRDDLYAGRVPKVKRGADGKLVDANTGLTVAGLCNAFLTAKLRKLEAGELGARMFQEYRETTDLLVAAFGKDRRIDDLAADDFEKLRADMAERWGPVRLGNAITRVKSVFKYGIDNALIERAMRYGSEFKKPGKAVLRRHKARSGERMLEAADCRRLVEAADVQLRAAILLGLNAGYGNHDVAAIPFSALNLETGWADYPRPKTGILRRCPLWPETVRAIREAISARRQPADDVHAQLVFLNERGAPLVRDTEKSRTDSLSVQFGELLKKLSLHKDGTGFYVLRHVHRTVADGARDPVACDLVMGHADPSMAGQYRERIEDTRLVAVSEHVRQWLWPKPVEQGPVKPEQGKRRASKVKAVEAPAERPRLRLFAG